MPSTTSAEHLNRTRNNRGGWRRPFFIMHLKNRPTYFVKNGIRKPVYYSVDARQLIDNGWIEEGSSVTPEPAKEASVTMPEPKEEAAPEPVAEVNLEDMTRAELVKFAEANDVEFKSYGTKSEILEACSKLIRARNTDGTFVADDPATPEVNEAWMSIDG